MKINEEQTILEKANDFKQMYELSSNYLSQKRSLEGKTFKDWKYETQKFDPKTNYKAVVFKNDKTKEIAIFNIGTDFKNKRDVIDDVKMGFGKVTNQMKQARKYHDEISKTYPGYKMNVAGHSEGGSESQYVGANHPDTDVYTFNAYGIGKNREIKSIQSDFSNIYNFRDPQDPVSKIGKNIGKDYIVPINNVESRKPSIFGYKDAHQIKNMGDVNNSLTPVEYKKRSRNLGFIDNIDNVLFTNEDIGNLDGFTFDVFSQHIDKLLKEQAIMPRVEAEFRAANNGGIIYVNGYTRSDGVKVSGYYRRA